MQLIARIVYGLVEQSSKTRTAIHMEAVDRQPPTSRKPPRCSRVSSGANTCEELD
jgi:hypothetical protein